MQTLYWRKSTYSGDSSNCVEIATAPASVHVRDGKNTEGPHLAFPTAVWTLFLSHTASPTSPMWDFT